MPARPNKGGRVAAVRRQREKIQARNEIGDVVYAGGRARNGWAIPGDRQRRNGCKKSLRRFARVYMPASFPLPWSRDHEIVLDRLERAILRGGRFAVAMPRGSGKTTIFEAAMVWAICYGHRRHIVIVGATEKAAQSILASAYTELESNPLLRADFPTLAVPLAMLDGKANRAGSQMVYGRPTGIMMTRAFFRAADLPGTSREVIVECVGLTGAFRGKRIKLRSGKVSRPDMVLCDDPQTDESAASSTQTESREKLLLGAVMGMAGPDTRLAAVMACTVIETDDLSARFLDADRHPDWQGVRTGLVIQWPDEIDGMWQQYRKIRAAGLNNQDGGEAGTAYYQKHRAAMDAGAIMSWPERYEPHQLSALQYAMDLLFDLGRQVFFAEYQNDPEKAVTAQINLTWQKVAASINSLPVRVLPARAHVCGAHIDVNHYGLHWSVIGAEPDLTGYLADYGVFPGGKQVIVKPNASEGARRTGIFQALAGLCRALEGYEIDRPGPVARPDLVLIDCGYELETVFRFVAAYTGALRLLPMRGRACSQYNPRVANAVDKRLHDHCVWTRYATQGNAQVIEADTDWWRLQVHRAFLLAPGEPGSLSLPGESDTAHEAYARQIVGEYLVEHLIGQKAEKYVWGHVRGQIWDWLDSTTGALVACHMLGARFGQQDAPPRRRKRGRRKARVPMQ